MHGGGASFLRLICLDQIASHSVYHATVGVFGCVSQVTGGEDAFDLGSPGLVADDFVDVVQIKTQLVWQTAPRVRANLDAHAI